MLLQTINFLQQQVTLDVGAHFYDPKAIIIRLNHSKLAEAVCSWAGVPQERRQNVAEVQYFVSPVPHICGIISADTFFFCVYQFFSSTLVQYWPNKADRKSQWSLIRGQLLQVQAPQYTIKPWWYFNSCCFID